MTVQMALSQAGNDLILKDGGGIERVTDGRYTVQLVKNRLNTFLGEWLLNPTIGWLNFDDFERNPDLFDIEMRARTIILGTTGVLSVDSATLELSKRVLTITFEATTIYGGIELTIPWSLL